MSETEEVINAVEKLNEAITEKYTKRGDFDNMPELYYLISPSFTGVELMIPDHEHIHIWNSENSERIYYEQTDTEESIYKCIQRLFREYKEVINKIKF